MQKKHCRYLFIKCTENIFPEDLNVFLNILPFPKKMNVFSSS